MDFYQKLQLKLSFLANKSQISAINQIESFLFSNSENIFILRGYAGTGKTSIIGALVKLLKEHRVPVRLMAPTGRAAKVFSAMADSTALTIHKSIYRLHKFGPQMDDFELMNNPLPGTLFICDEASMISTLNEGSPYGSGNLLADLIEYIYSQQGCRLMLVGDTAQLPPVGQSISPGLSKEYIAGFGIQVMEAELTEVARQRLESGILWNATMLREKISRLEVNELPKLHVKEFADVRLTVGEEFIENLSQSYYRQGLDDTIIITRSNARASKFNLGVRNRILDREEELSAGDRLMVVKNNYYWGRQFDEKIPFIANGDIVTVKRVCETMNLYGFRFARVEISMPDYDIDTEVIVMLDTLTNDSPSLSPELQQQLFYNVAADYPELHNQRDLYKAVKDNKFYNALQVKYAYCITCHKSQGGQWQDVYLDLSYINPDHLGLDFYRWMYTAFTRARNTIYLVGPSKDLIEGGIEEDF